MTWVSQDVKKYKAHMKRTDYREQFLWCYYLIFIHLPPTNVNGLKQILQQIAHALSSPPSQSFRPLLSRKPNKKLNPLDPSS